MSSSWSSDRRGLRAYAELLRPANVVTAWADVLAGYGCAGAAGWLIGDGGWVHEPARLAALLAATSGLYAGGIVLNDVMDAELDAAERPSRPIPSGRVSRRAAAGLAAVLLAAGIGCAAMVSGVAAGVASAVAVAAVVYDVIGKHRAWLGIVNMGLCRAGNLMLGLSAVPALLASRWALGVIPLLYIAAATLISRGEVHGGSRVRSGLALALLTASLGGVAAVGLRAGSQSAVALVFVAALATRVLVPFARATGTPSAEHCRRAVGAAITSLVLLDAAVAAGFAGAGYGLLIALLLPLSTRLSRAFEVT